MTQYSTDRTYPGYKSHAEIIKRPSFFKLHCIQENTHNERKFTVPRPNQTNGIHSSIRSRLNSVISCSFQRQTPATRELGLTAQSRLIVLCLGSYLTEEPEAAVQDIFRRQTPFSTLVTEIRKLIFSNFKFMFRD